jgi:hypothetical protein
MKTLIIAISTFIITFWAQVSMASISPTISCSTPNKNKSFIITDDKVVFEKEDLQPSIRSIASVDKVKTKKEGSGFTKTLIYEGNKYTIHVNNEEKFDDVEDYLSIRSEKGHEITYPINCKTT